LLIINIKERDSKYKLKTSEIKIFRLSICNRLSTRGK